MIKQQTAVEWLVRKINNEMIGEIPMHRWNQIREIVEKAKEMEKQQMVEFTDDFWFHCVNRDGSIKITPEQYYEQTYGGNK